MKCQCLKKDGAPCAYNAKPGLDLCGVHAKCASRNQAHVRPQMPQIRQVPQMPQRVQQKQKYEATKIKTGDRLSARAYYDRYGASSVGDRCNIRGDGEYKCLVLRANNLPFWQAKTKVPKPICEDYSPRCKDPDF
jgi:hypothetical protein